MIQYITPESYIVQSVENFNDIPLKEGQKTAIILELSYVLANMSVNNNKLSAYNAFIPNVVFDAIEGKEDEKIKEVLTPYLNIRNNLFQHEPIVFKKIFSVHNFDVSQKNIERLGEVYKPTDAQLLWAWAYDSIEALEAFIESLGFPTFTTQ